MTTLLPPLFPSRVLWQSHYNRGFLIISWHHKQPRVPVRQRFEDPLPYFGPPSKKIMKKLITVTKIGPVKNMHKIWGTKIWGGNQIGVSTSCRFKEGKSRNSDLRAWFSPYLWLCLLTNTHPIVSNPSPATSWHNFTIHGYSWLYPLFHTAQECSHDFSCVCVFSSLLYDSVWLLLSLCCCLAQPSPF